LIRRNNPVSPQLKFSTLKSIDVDVSNYPTGVYNSSKFTELEINLNVLECHVEVCTWG